ncbi:porin family protein [Marinihelvus fidelis]|uniref:Porin family protein n=1 Tax=Marinihelvus fidelis TaxID=2613842 RepID=A0A5N0TJ81_9GAMM|nr:outer membrane beta-barrel protein [Marinihelvus fidelis]KAA9134167.1 porin family protein [Marinihelvus fidelis]
MAFNPKSITKATAVLAPFAALLFSGSVAADSGAYIGGSIGQSYVDMDCCGSEDDSAWKVFGGYNFDITFINLAIEGEYIDFGTFSDTYVGTSTRHYSYDTSALAGFGVAGLDLGFIGFFAKAGIADWDAGSGQDGTDPAYGIGARLTFSSVEVRAEYEYFDIDSSRLSDLSLLSIGAAWTF